MIPVAPGPNKSFDAFGADQAVCQQYAAAQTAPAVAAANSQAVGGALLTTALGAGLGAAIGGGRGAAIGAASGATLGTVAGASGYGYAQMSVQQQYDILYGQCMAARGNQVPGFSPPPDAPRYPGGPMPPPGPQPYYGPRGTPPGYPRARRRSRRLRGTEPAPAPSVLRSCEKARGEMARSDGLDEKPRGDRRPESVRRHDPGPFAAIDHDEGRTSKGCLRLGAAAGEARSAAAFASRSR